MQENCEFCNEPLPSDRSESNGLIWCVVHPCPNPSCEVPRLVAVAEAKAEELVYGAQRLAAATKLHCDLCQALIGYVNEFDLEGSRFYCCACKNKA